MGLRAANYLFTVRGVEKEDFTRNIAMEFADIVTLNTDKYYKRGNDFWIDLMLSSDNEYIALSIRVALCNPVNPVMNALREFLQLLFNNFPQGILTDRDSKRQYRVMEEEDWQLVAKDYLVRYATFKTIYGELNAPISDDDFHSKFGQ